MGGLMDDRASSVAKDVKEPGQGEAAGSGKAPQCSTAAERREDVRRA
jgi:hypothetical protein